MKTGSRRIKSIKNRIRKKTLSRKMSRQMSGGKKSRRHMKKHRQSGGYSQYQNNLPMTATYQVAGINLPASHLAEANPAPITKLSNCVNCVDNYNHYTNKGFPSPGH